MAHLPSIVNGWRQRSIDLVPESWTVVGSASFSEIKGSVQGFYINLEVSDGLAIEATVDNIGLTPVPELDPRMMLAAGILAIGLQFRRGRKQLR